MGIGFTVTSAWSQKTTNEITYQFEQERVVIGRGPGSDVRLPDRTVSEIHAFIRLEGNAYIIIDNDSTNGTSVNGVALVPGKQKSLTNGDSIEIGEYVLTIHTGVPIALPTSAERTASLARRLIREIRSPSISEINPPKLTIRNGKQADQFLEIPPPPSRLLVGRSPKCQLVIDDPDVSREHMELIRDLDGVIARNLDSKNGIVVNNQPISELRLRNGFELELGSTILRFEEPADLSIHALSDQPDLPTARSVQDGPFDKGKAILRLDSAVNIGTSAAAPMKRTKLPLATADIVVYLIAGIIAVSSIAGLIVLLSTD
jgi:pSer/pThr/pTyr-binding forkhead associated (FHA) protein